jgi:hypothetical protein
MTEQAKVYVSDLHFEHMQWLSNLKFWDEELIPSTKARRSRRKIY